MLKKESFNIPPVLNQTIEFLNGGRGPQADLNVNFDSRSEYGGELVK